jgi:hypothetical protein
MSQHIFAVCVQNQDYEVSLERRKLYLALPDAVAEEHDQIRIVYESGGDYLYPKDYFVVVDVPEVIERKVLDAA